MNSGRNLTGSSLYQLLQHVQLNQSDCGLQKGHTMAYLSFQELFCSRKKKKKKEISLQVLAFLECCVNIKSSQALSQSWSYFVCVQAGPSSQTYINKLLQEPCLSYSVSQLQRFSRALLILFSLTVSPEDTKQEIVGL